MSGDAWVSSHTMTYLLTRLKAAEAVCEATQHLVKQFDELREEQMEKLVLHQTLYSASENWNQLDKTIDFAPAVKQLLDWQKARDDNT